MTKSQIGVERGHYNALRQLAERLGYIQPRGQRAGDGSPAQLVEAIARAYNDDPAGVEAALAAMLKREEGGRG